jgi:sodium-independent sulfate anion transporter 11
MGLLTAGIIADCLSYDLNVEVIAGVITFVVGTYALLVDLFRLGFILDFVSLPVLSGFVSAVAVTIILSQIPALFGITGVGSGTAATVHDIAVRLPQTKPLTFVIGVSGILLLTIIQQAANRWGTQFCSLWVLYITRNAIVLLTFTTINFLVNKDLKTRLFDVSNISGTSIKAPVLPSLSLAMKIAGPCFIVFIALALEHLAIAKAFGRRSGYVIDVSQELCFLRASNLFNGFFTTMPTGGSFSRTSVNADSGVKSPFSGLLTSSFVILSIYFLTPALFWIPKATLSAIIITAVCQIIAPPSTFYGYWRTSMSDLISSMISFWVTLFGFRENRPFFCCNFQYNQPPPQHHLLKYFNALPR